MRNYYATCLLTLLLYDCCQVSCAASGHFCTRMIIYCVCFSLYSSAVYENHFDKYTPAEILQRPVEDLVLQMKVCMHLACISVFCVSTF